MQQAFSCCRICVPGLALVFASAHFICRDRVACPMEPAAWGLGSHLTAELVQCIRFAGAFILTPKGEKPAEEEVWFCSCRRRRNYRVLDFESRRFVVWARVRVAGWQSGRRTESGCQGGERAIAAAAPTCFKWAHWANTRAQSDNEWLIIS